MEKALYKNEYIEDLFSSKYLNEKGYSLVFKLNNDELQKIREYIYDQWIYRIQLLDKSLLKFIKNKTIYSSVSPTPAPVFESSSACCCSCSSKGIIE